MGKQYKKLTNKDIDFIKKQKLFYIASSSGKEVNLSPKGYDTIKVLNDSTLVFMSYPGSGNRSYTDAKGNGEFTLVFNAFEGTPKILRLFCKATIMKRDSNKFKDYINLFKEDKNIIRNFFEFHIYAVESSCGTSVPIMEYKEDRTSLRDWAVNMDKKNKLEEFKQNYLIPPNLKNIK